MSTSRRRFLHVVCPLAALLAASLLLAPAASAQAPRRFNVLFLASDDMRPQLACYGEALVKSPNLDRLASQGILFNRAYCQQALCSPSRISLLSGRHPWTTKIHAIGPTLRSTMPDIVTLPQHFKNNGYFTRSLGKIYHIGIDDPASWSVPSWVSRAPRLGFEGRKLVSAKAKALREAGKLDPDTRTTPGKVNKDMPIYATPAFEAPDVADDALTDGDCANKAIECLRKLARKPDQPFFLAVGFVNPHVPWVAPKKYFDLYNLSDIKIPDNRYPPHNAPAYAATSGADFYWYGNVPKDRNITDDFGRQCLQGYMAAISYVDACVGRVVDELERLKLADNTIIIFWGDHGYYMGEHNWWGGKHNNYEGATRAPLMIRVPGMKTAGQKTDRLVEFVDIYPSLAELCGLPKAPGLEGLSFVPLLENPTREWPKVAFSEYPKGGNMGTAMRTDRYRYVQWINKAGKLAAQELYDHVADPQENENIAAKPENAPLIAELSRQLHAHVRAR